MIHFKSKYEFQNGMKRRLEFLSSELPIKSLNKCISMGRNHVQILGGLAIVRTYQDKLFFFFFTKSGTRYGNTMNISSKMNN